MTVFVPVVLTEDQARAAANACAMVFVQGKGLLSPSHPVFTAAIAIEDAMNREGLIELGRHRKAKGNNE